MKEFDYSDCVLDENYFFVYNGVVYYGTASKASWDEGDEPTRFVIKVSGELDWKDLCNIWDADLIYKL